MSTDYSDKFFNFCGKPENGGGFFDYFICRGEGDTPIVLATELPKLASVVMATGRQIELESFISYLEKYKPCEPNNHLIWKWVALLSMGFLNREKFYSDLEKILNSYDEHGANHLELKRGSRAISYTLMNIEGLWNLVSYMKVNIELFKISAFKETLRKAFLATDYFFQILEDGYKDAHRPQDITDWGWVGYFPHKFTSDESWLRHIRYYGKHVPRSYNLIFPELFQF